MNKLINIFLIYFLSKRKDLCSFLRNLSIHANFFSKIYIVQHLSKKKMGVMALDAKDRKILAELDLNAREFVSVIAKRVGLSKEVVNYRIKRLIDKNVIGGFHALVDTSKTGYRIYRLFIKYQSIDPEQEKELLSYLSQHPCIGWIADYESVYDLAVLFWARDSYIFREMCDELLTKYGKHFQTTVKTLVMRIYNFKHNYLFESDDYKQAVIGGPVVQISLDKMDFEILQMLANDCRLTTLDIGKKLNLSPNTVKYRIKKLISNDVIVGFRTKINVASLGYQHYKIFLTLHDLTPMVRKEIISYLKVNSHVVYVTDAIGPADLEFEVHVKDIKQLHSLIRDIKQRFSEVIRDSEAALIFKEHRINYLPSANGSKSFVK